MIETLKNFGLSFGKFVLIAFITICALFVLSAFLRIGLIYGIYVMVEEWTAVRLGFDYYVSNLLATAFTAIFSMLLPTLAWYLFLGKKQAWGIGTLVGVQLLICCAIYTVGSSVCFDRRTGKPLCYFADTPKGRVWSYTPGFDPASGKDFRLFTREIKEAEEQRKIEIKSPAMLPPRSVIVKPDLPAAAATPSPNFLIGGRDDNETVVRKISPVRSEPLREAETAVQTKAVPEYKTSEGTSETEKFRQDQEDHRREISERARRQAEEQRRSAESENNRIKAESERLERERQAASEARLAREERECRIAAEREERLRREKDGRRQETLKTVVNIAQPIIERLTRRKN